MAFSISPAVDIREIDLTTVVPNIATTIGALAGVFRWGPVDQVTLIDSEQELVELMGRPTNFNPETWFTAKAFLDYADSLYISRAADVTGNNVTKSYNGNTENLIVEEGNNSYRIGNSSVGNTDLITVGMIAFFSNNTSIPIGATVLSVNSTAVVLSESAKADVANAEIGFRENIVYTALALQADLNYDLSDVGNWAGQVVKNPDHYDSRVANGQTFDVAALFAARYPGTMGNSLRVSVCDTNDQYKSNTDLSPNAQFDTTNTMACALVGNVGSNSFTFYVTPANTANVTQVATINAFAADVVASLSVGDLIEVGNTRIGLQFLKVTDVGDLGMTSNVWSFSITGDDELKLSTNSINGYLSRYWEFHNSVDSPPQQSDYVLAVGNSSANDELHVVVVDEGGKFTGTPGTVLEVWRNLSRATDCKSSDGTDLYYKTVINQRSQYIWWANDRTTATSNTAAFLESSSATIPMNARLQGGGDGLPEGNVSFGTLAFAWDLFSDTEDIDINLVLQGKARGEPVSHYTQLGNYLIDNICERRKDCVAFISPDVDDVVFNNHFEAKDVVDFRLQLRSSSYGVLDANYKYTYDKYNDVYRWIPLNGDMAGLCARTDQTNDPWWSPAGYNRGAIKNVVRLAWNPKKADRDLLYKNGANPVITDRKGLGTVLFGDKTLLARPSAFDRINVRRLFIVLEKSIATAAKFTLFEFNDDFTRAQFRNLVNPYLRDVQGRRGLYDFLVVCDATNNTPEIIDRNEFVADIYLKPARSINFITLNFVAVRTGVAFSEVVGKAF